MIFRVVVLPEARLDFLRLSAFLVEKSPNAASRARDVLNAASRSLGHMPERGARRSEDGLLALTVPFGSAGYVIRYRIEGAAVLIVRVFHTREDR